MKKHIKASNRLHGVAIVPGDKSVSHRAMIFGAIASGKTEALNLLDSGDVHSTQNCLRALGVEISGNAARTVVNGRGKHGLIQPKDILDCGNSGTTMRLLMGLLAGQGFSATLTGDNSLIKRPMKRVAGPLTLMGAEFTLTNGDFAPLTVHSRQHQKLKGIDYHLKIASAQVKTSLLLAGLYAEGMTTLRGEIGSRDHTERLLPFFGADLKISPESISISGLAELAGATIRVPGDPSSAAFWIAAAGLIKNSDVEIQNVSLNPTRTGFMNVAKRMGIRIETETTVEQPEPIGNLRVRSGDLCGTSVAPHEIPSMIDEIPILAVLATQAHGVTEVHGAEELRVKESDRIETVAQNLRAMGAKIETFKDGFRIEGPQSLQGCAIETFLDHRIAMSFSIAGLVAKGETEIRGVDSVLTSYPNFYEVLGALTGVL
ncbi:MAG: 3-phosphoshikimate 1-carboxyvinyltransferase [Bdellovibrionales bacterium]|nr:3-phosphoshikimate 1-carboxyvinyltransferase [Bdellovibrionales bacterium]